MPTLVDVISSIVIRSPTVSPLVARQPFMKIAYFDLFTTGGHYSAGGYVAILGVVKIFDTFF